MEIIWEVFVNTYETILVCYLFSRKLGYSRNHILRIVISFFATVTILSILTFIDITVSQRMFLMVLVHIWVAFWAFGDDAHPRGGRTFLWAVCYLMGVTVADNIVVSLATVFITSPLEKLLNFTKVRVQFAILYLFLCTIMVWVLCRIGEKNPLFPAPITTLLMILIVIGILATESIMDIGLDLGTHPDMENYSQQLSWMCYIVFAMLFALVGTFEYLGIVRRKNLKLEQQKQMAELEQQQYDLMVSATKSLREWKHDYKGQLRLMSALMDAEKYDELRQFTDELNESLPVEGFLLSTGNMAVDAVISLRMIEANRSQIQMETTVYLPNTIPLNNVEFSSLISNLLDNALEACRKREEGERKIQFEIKPWRKMLYLSCTNTSDGKYRKNQAGYLLSTKKAAGHGIGIQRIQQIVGQAGGSVQLVPGDTLFTATVMIPLEGDCS